MSQEFDTAFNELKEKVTSMRTVVDSNNALLDGLSALIRENADNPAKIREVATMIDEERSDLSAAVVRNTPAANPGETPPTGETLDQLQARRGRNA